MDFNEQAADIVCSVLEEAYPNMDVGVSSDADYWVETRGAVILIKTPTGASVSEDVIQQMQDRVDDEVERRHLERRGELEETREDVSVCFELLV